MRVKTAAGVLVLAAAVALAVGVLPAMGALVNPEPLDWGGGSGACDAEVGSLPSAGALEAHDNNPQNGDIVVGPDESEFTLTVYSNNTFDWELTKDNSPDGNLLVYDVVVNGGPKSLLWDYDANGETPVADDGLHAPKKGQGFHNLSHVTICYGPPGLVIFECPPDNEETKTEEEGTFREATVEIVQNSLWDCEFKRGILSINNNDTPPSVALGFNVDGAGDDTVAGRLDITKMFDLTSEDFAPLLYSETTFGVADEVPWCKTRPFTSTGPSGLSDGNEFSEWLGTTEYPKLPSGETACKVAEEEDVSGRQYTVVYFEFLDPFFY